MGIHPSRSFRPTPVFLDIGNVALHAPDDRNQPSCGESDRSGATRHVGLPLWPIQAKLEVGAVDDPLEREADQVAGQVMHMPDASAIAAPGVMGGGIPGIQRKC
jgi:hypothetical protein